MTQELHLQPQFLDTIVTIQKKMIHFVYSHSSIFDQQRKDRTLNRSNLLHFHPYSIQIELYQLDRLQRPTFIAIWKYPIHFDYLPVFRLSKVLHLISAEQNPSSMSQQSMSFK